MKKIFISALITLSLYFNSCSEDVLNNPQIKSTGNISGSVIDSLCLFPLSAVGLNLNSNNLTSITDSNGKFYFNNIPVGRHIIFLSSVGYLNKETEINLIDSLLKIDSITMIRRTYAFDTIDFGELPDLRRPDSTYYRLDYDAFQRPKHYWNSPYWDSIHVNNFIDSLIIGMLRLNISIDTLWYQSNEPQCSDQAFAFLPKIAVKTKTPDANMYTLNFVSPDPNPLFVFLVWEQCPVYPMHYRKYYKFN